MRIFFNRPLCRFSFAYLCSLLFSLVFFECNAAFILASLCVSFLGGLAVFAIPRARKYKKVIFSVLLGLLFGFALSLALFSPAQKQASSLVGHRAEVVGKVSEVTSQSDSAVSFVFEIRQIDGENAGIKISATDWSNADIRKGDTLRASAEFFAPENEVGGYAEKNHLLSKGIFVCAELEGVEILAHDEPFDLFVRIGDMVERNIARSLTDDSSAFLSALLLGRTARLPDNLRGGFMRLGISHLLAISGAHFVLLLGIVSFFLDRICPYLKLRRLILVFVALFYMSLVGFNMAVCRAGVMTLFVTATSFVRAKNDGVTSLFSAVTLLCLISPCSILDVGLWLSFSATLCLLLISNYQSRKNTQINYFYGAHWYIGLVSREKKRGKFVTFFALPVLAAMSTLPLSSLFFGEVSAFGAIATLLLSNIFDILLILALLIGLGAGVLGVIADPLCSFVMAVTDRFAGLGAAVVSLLTPYAIFAVAALFLCIFTLLMIKISRKVFSKALTSIIACFCIIMIAGGALTRYFSERSATIVFSNIAQNDAVALYHDSSSTVIDMSNGSYSIIGQSLHSLKRLGKTEIDNLVITHYHARHIATVYRLASSYRVKTLCLTAPQSANDESVRDRLIDIAEKFDLEIYYYDTASELGIGKCVIPKIEKEYISRSSQPIIHFEILSPWGEFMYLGSAFSELDIEIPKDSLVVCGEHGPPFDKKFDSNSNFYLGAGASTHARGDYNILPECLQIVLK